MPLSESLILQTLMRWRTRISAAVWLNLRDVHTAEDIFQNVVLKAMTRGRCLRHGKRLALVGFYFRQARSNRLGSSKPSRKAFFVRARDGVDPPMIGCLIVNL